MTSLDLPFDQQHPPEFDGETYEPAEDQARLTGQALAVFQTMQGGAWWTLCSLSNATGASEASVSARLRDFRKARFGAHTVERERVSKGLWRYRLIVNPRLPLTTP